MKSKFYLTALATCCALAISSAYAAPSNENDALSVHAAKISMVQAVTAAEQHVGGQASRAEYELHKNKPVFDVEVVKAQTVMDVKVDAESGKIISSTVDRAEHDDARDQAD